VKLFFLFTETVKKAKRTTYHTNMRCLYNVFLEKHTQLAAWLAMVHIIVGKILNKMW